MSDAEFAAEESPNVRRRRDQKGRVKDDPRANFQLYFHPSDWQLTAAGEFRPVFCHVSKEPGSGAVRPDGDFALEADRLRKAGWIAIDHEILGEGTDYVAPFRNAKGKLVHRSIFQTPFVGEGGQTDWRFDDEAFAAFVRLLRKMKVIKPPTPSLVVGHLERARERLAGQAERGGQVHW